MLQPNLEIRQFTNWSAISRISQLYFKLIGWLVREISRISQPIREMARDHRPIREMNKGSWPVCKMPKSAGIACKMT